MSKIKISLNLIILILAFLYSNVNSQTSFGDGLSKAKSSNKIALINIYMDDDRWSQKMDAVYSNGKIKSIVEGSFVYIKLNANGSEVYNYGGKDYVAKDLAKFFGATGYPTHVFLQPDGSLIQFKNNGANSQNYPGFINEPEFEKLLNYISSGQYKNTDLSKIL